MVNTKKHFHDESEILAFHGYQSFEEDGANALYDRLIEQYKIKRNISEELKEKNQMKWVQEMNNIQNCAEEIINKQIIHI